MAPKKANKYKQKPWMPDYGLVEADYVWWQSPEEVLVSIETPSGVRARDLDVEIHMHSIKVAMKDGSKTFIAGKLSGPISVDASTWCKDGDEIEMTLTKGEGSEKWWPCVVEGGTHVDVQGIEGSQYVDDSLQRRIYEEKQRKEEQEAAEGKTPEGESAGDSDMQDAAEETKE